MTLYGILDIGPTYVSNQNGSSAVAVTSSYVQQSRFGFKGIEDLGGGYSALFILESGFALNNGQISNNQIFSRKAVVGIEMPYGTLTAGHDTTAISTQCSPSIRRCSFTAPAILPSIQAITTAFSV